MDENEEQDAYDDTVTEYAASLDENGGYGCFTLTLCLASAVLGWILCAAFW